MPNPRKATLLKSRSRKSDWNRTVETVFVAGLLLIRDFDKTRLPGRVEPGATSFGSEIDLASAFRRTEAAHGEHEIRTGQRDANWPDWYAAYMVAEQSGKDLPR